MINLLIYFLLTTILVLLLYNYKSGIITCLMVITNFGEFIYVNPNLEIGDFGGIGTIYFMDLFFLSLLIAVLLKISNLKDFNYKLSVLIFLILSTVAFVIPLLINSFSLKDTISVIRPFGNLLLLPYLVVTIKDMKQFNFFEKAIVYMVFFFIVIQVTEYISQKRIPFRLFESDSLFFGEDPFSVEFGGIKTGYIWSRIGYLLPFNLLFGCYYFFSEKRNYGLLLLTAYLLSIMIALSRIWIIGFAFFLLAISIFFFLRKDSRENVRLKLIAFIGSFALIGVILLFTSSTFNQIFDIFLLRVNSINDLADKTDSSFLGREYILFQMISIWAEYPLFGTGFSSISRNLVTNDLGFPNIITIFGTSGIFLLSVFFYQYYKNIKPFIQEHYILFVSLASVMLMIIFMSIFSIDMFYFNATGAILMAIGNILYNISKQEDSTEEAGYNYAA